MAKTKLSKAEKEFIEGELKFMGPGVEGVENGR